ncbi:hypothetical protein DB30_01263 [Enhygromyxa salina]|uniref:Uncharacterized protein n=1 Tax=Enhygromyxa salina TaxID=215803 RepID=A0A0C1ZN87_9BACT|nr:hypothetical protein [Enhygromyxa salina]KIG12553.1 hypothetical protein DB30_01263 [Enhygromyxa salina]
MTDPLFVTGEDPLNLDGTLDTSPALQLLHGSDSLASYDQALHAEHEDLDDPSGVIRVKLKDFASGGDNWEITAAHTNAAGTITWTRGTDHAYYDFGPMTSEQEVDVTATSDASPPATKQRTIRIKASPIDAQPDRPRR